MHSNEQTSSSDEDFSKMMRYAYVFRVPAPVLMVKMRKKRRKSNLSLQTRKITFTKLFSMFFMIRAKLRQKRARIFEDSDDSDVVEFPETIFHEGNEFGDNSKGSGSDMDFEVGTIQSEMGRCILCCQVALFLFPKCW